MLENVILIILEGFVQVRIRYQRIEAENRLLGW